MLNKSKQYIIPAGMEKFRKMFTDLYENWYWLKIIEGPWGGGNLFAINLSNYLAEKSNDVYMIYRPNVDLILLTDPKVSESSSTFNHIDILKYKNMSTQMYL